jgi:hypothetical protein
LADKGYNSEEIVKMVQAVEMEICISPRGDRKNQLIYDKELYKKAIFGKKHLLQLKQWRGIATRYA